MAPGSRPAWTFAPASSAAQSPENQSRPRSSQPSSSAAAGFAPASPRTAAKARAAQPRRTVRSPIRFSFRAVGAGFTYPFQVPRDPRTVSRACSPGGQRTNRGAQMLGTKDSTELSPQLDLQLKHRRFAPELEDVDVRIGQHALGLERARDTHL